MTEDADPNGELQTISLDANECGATFSVDHVTYRKMASACLATPHCDLMSIRRCHSGPGCIVELFSRDALMTLYVGERTLALFLQDLDDVGPVEALHEETNSNQGWRRTASAMKQLGGRSIET